VRRCCRDADDEQVAESLVETILAGTRANRSTPGLIRNGRWESATYCAAQMALKNIPTAEH
jgi:hypothetical protein